MTTRFDQWDSNTSDDTGLWVWRSGNGTGGSMTTALTLTQAGNATFAGATYTNGIIRSRKNIVSNSTYNVISLNNSRSIDDYGGLNKDYMKIDLVTPGPNTDGENSAHGFGSFSLKLANNAGSTAMSEVLNITAGGNATFIGNVTVNGNLTVGGTTTTLNTETIEVEDNILQLNTTQGSPDTATATTSGISIYRGNGVTQASFIFDDGDDTWDLTNNLGVADHVGIGAAPSTTSQLYVNQTEGWTGSQYAIFANTYSVFGNLRIAGNDANRSVYQQNDANLGIGTQYNRDINFFTNTGSIRMTVTGAGRVGIGTASPSELLEVAGNGTFQGSVNINTNGLIKYEQNTDVDSSAAEAVASVVHGTHTAAFFDYVIKKGTNVRAGIVVACHDGTNVEYAETSTVDLGDTTDVTLSVDISGIYMRLIATTTSNDWSVKSLIRGI
jgi:hypothetical protein